MSLFWTLVLIAAVVAMVVGPVSMMRLNPSEQRQEALRRAARDLGLAVRLQPWPSAAGDGTKIFLPTYSLPAKGGNRWHLTRANYAHDLHLHQWWSSRVEQRPPAHVLPLLDDVLPGLPPGVEALGANEMGVYICWRERGGPEALDALHHCLRTLARGGTSNEAFENK